jgi:Zn-dependent M28 family amino/carboxypeptidase
VLLLTLLAAMTVAAPAASAASGDGTHLPKYVTLKNIRNHQKALDDIAKANGGTRAVNTAGYEISARYVEKQITRDKNLNKYYTVKRDPFDYQFWEKNSPSQLERLAPAPRTFTESPDGVTGDFGTFNFSGSGEVSGTVQAVDTASADSGCEAADFAGFTAGNIALIKRGTCFFQDKATFAQAAGAIGVLIYNDGADDTRTGPLDGFDLQVPFSFPVLGPRFAVGSELVTQANAGGLRMRLKVDSTTGTRTSFNVIVETKRGAADNVVVVGAHLDSVPEGPGINDNGSGTAAILEMARQLPRLGGNVKNKVRFAFWGAEELGLFGSTAYVADQVANGQIANIALNLNFDMLGSPNFVRFIYDGDNSTEAGAEGPAGSGAIEKAFTDYLDGRKLANEETPFDGRSDYGPFIAQGIPAGGLFSGAEEPKTAEQAATYGGTAGQPLDPCYHQACDTFANNSNKSLDQLSDAAASVTEKYAYSTLEVNGAASLRRAGAQRRADFRGPLRVR